MRTKSLLVIGVVVLTAFAGPVEAQKGKLPQGQPFQILRNAISQTEQTLLQQIENLQAQLNANTANDETQRQLIAAMQTLALQLEGTLSDTQATLSELAAYNELQQQLLQEQLAQVAALQAQVGTMSDQSQLFQLYQAQQAALTTLTTQIDFLTSQNQVQQGDLASLHTQLATLKNAYEQTAARLATGCPANSSIRQLTSSTVACETDNITGAQSTEFIGTAVAAAAGATVTAEVFCPTSPAYVVSGGGMSATGPVMMMQSAKLPNGWRVIAHNPSASSVGVQARVTCVR